MSLLGKQRLKILVTETGIALVTETHKNNSEYRNTDWKYFVAETELDTEYKNTNQSESGTGHMLN